MTVIDQIYTLPYRPLTRDEEHDLIVQARSGDKGAMLQVLRNYIPKILHVVQTAYARRGRSGVRWDDLVAAALASAVDVIHTVNLETTGRLGAPLHNAITNDLADLKTDARLPMRVPHAVVWRYHHARTAAAGSADDVTWDTNGQDIAPEVGLSARMYANVDALYRSQSLDAGGPTAESTDVRTPYVQVEVLEDVAAALRALDPRAYKVITTLYGIDGEPMSARQAAAALGIPRTTVLRIAAAALETMRAELGA